MKKTLPTKLYSAQQVREMDKIAIEAQGMAGIDLMRKAGQAVFNLIQQHDPKTNLTVFCGAGNNAGDGYVIATLAQKAAINVTVYYCSDPEQLGGDALLAYQDYMQTGATVVAYTDDTVIEHSVIVDALLGTGLNRQVSGLYEKAIQLINDSSYPVVSVDIPSGLNADTGSLMGCAVKADYTVSFIGLKQGMFSGFAAEYCGDIHFSSLGIDENILNTVDYASTLIQKYCLPKRHRCSHKGHYGHLLIVGGEVGFSGAIRLAAEAALRSGAGLVSVATRQAHASLINLGRPELMCHSVEHTSELIPLLNKATVIVIGTGLGQNSWGKALFEKIIASDKPLVIDADALNLLANHHLYKENWVLTPHPGEAARLLACSTKDIGNDRFAAVTALQKKYGGIVVLKGVGSLISNGHEITVSTTGNPGMASGGMGDTLAGIIGALIGQQMPLYKATTSAVYVHGKAADLSAQQQGEIGLLASDLMPFIRQLINQ